MTHSQQQSAPQNQQFSAPIIEHKTNQQALEVINKLKSGEMKFIC